MNRKYLIAILMQAVGPLALLFASSFIARFWGISEQGYYASGKSLLDVLLALGCFGFPQSIVLSVNRDMVSRFDIYSLSFRYFFILMPIISMAVYYLNDMYSLFEALIITIGAAFFIIAMIWRGLVLTIDDGYIFNLFTLMPTLSLTVFSIISMLAFDSFLISMPYVILCSGVFSFLICRSIIPLNKFSFGGSNRPNIYILFRDGADVFVQAALGMAQIFLCYSWLKEVAAIESVGYFSLAVIFLNICSFPLQAVAPLIFNRLSSIDKKYSLSWGGRKFLFFFLLIIVFSMSGSLFVPLFISVIYGDSLLQGSDISELLLLALPFVVLLKLGNLKLAASGNLRFNSLISIVKFLVFTSMLYTSSFWGVNLSAISCAALAWIFSESISALAVYIKVHSLHAKLYGS